MPSKIPMQSDVMALVRSLPTVKDAVQAKQGLRALRDELLYRSKNDPLQLTDDAKLDELKISDLLLAWLHSSAGEKVLEDFVEAGADAVLEEFDSCLKQIELVQLNLAYVAPTEDLVRYHRWFNQVLGRPVMLDIRVDSKLMAGATFVYKNHLHDYSLLQKMPEIEAKLIEKKKSLA